MPHRGMIATRRASVHAPTAKMANVFRRARREKAPCRDKKTGVLDPGLLFRCVRNVSTTAAMTRTDSVMRSSQGASVRKSLSGSPCSMLGSLTQRGVEQRQGGPGYDSAFHDITSGSNNNGLG